MDDGARNTDGSSPSTRGALENGGTTGAGARLIPVYAGSTRRRRRGPWYQPAHPRLRGEHPDAAGGGQVGGGSSPSTRGAQGRPGVG